MCESDVCVLVTVRVSGVCGFVRACACLGMFLLGSVWAVVWLDVVLTRFACYAVIGCVMCCIKQVCWGANKQSKVWYWKMPVSSSLCWGKYRMGDRGPRRYREESKIRVLWQNLDPTPESKTVTILIQCQEELNLFFPLEISIASWRKEPKGEFAQYAKYVNCLVSMSPYKTPHSLYSLDYWDVHLSLLACFQ